jgi:hypothetical protein
LGIFDPGRQRIRETTCCLAEGTDYCHKSSRESEGLSDSGDLVRHSERAQSVMQCSVTLEAKRVITVGLHYPAIPKQRLPLMAVDATPMRADVDVFGSPTDHDTLHAWPATPLM